MKMRDDILKTVIGFVAGICLGCIILYCAAMVLM